MVADTYSTDGVGVLLMGTGNDNNTWGTNANTYVFQIAMDALTNVLTSAVTGGTLDLSGTPPPAAASQARYAALKFTGVLGSNQIVQVPNLNKWWLVCNATSGSFTLTFKTSGGSASTAIPQNSGWQRVRCDGANVIEVWPFNTAQVAMGDGTVAAPSYAWLNDLASGWYRAGTQDYRYSVNGVDVFQVTGAGAASPNIVAIGSGQTLQITALQLLSTDTGAGVAPSLDLYRNSASPATSDFLGSVDFNGKDSATNKQLYARLLAQITDPSSTTEDAIVLLQAVVAGSLTTLLQTSAAGIVIPSTSTLASAGAITPQGYLTPTSGLPVIASDVSAATAVYYTPFVGNLCPIYDGTYMVQYPFSELTLTLASQHTLNSIFDVFVFLNAGVVTLATGPAWTTITAGSGARGSGAGTTQLSRVNGIWTNTVQITGRNGATTYTIAANQATYVGSLYIDGTAGQVTCHKAYGQSRKWGVWNAYHRQPITLLMGDATSSWNYTTNTIRQSRADATNVLTTFTGLPEESVDVAFRQKVVGGSSNATSNSNVVWEIGIGVNVTNAYISGGKVGAAGAAVVPSTGNGAINLTADSTAYHSLAPTIGINNINSLERCTSATGTSVSCNFQGGADDMMFNAIWRG